MRHRRVAHAIAFASIVSSGLGFSSSAYAGDPAAAREQVKLGYQLSQDGKCEEAIPHFVESLKLDAKAITLINLASCEEKTAHLADALGHWVEARARAQVENNGGIEEEAEKRAKALEPKVPRLTVVVPGAPAADVEVSRDGVALGAASMGVPLPVNPGGHVLVVHVKGHLDTTENVSLAEGEAKTAELKVGAPTKEVAAAPTRGPAADGSSRPLSPLVFIGFGAALVGVGVGTVTGLMAFGKASTASDACPNKECTSAGLNAVDSGRTLGTISTVAFAVGAVGAGVGVYGLLFGKPSASTSVAVSLGPTGGALRGTF